MNLPRHIQILWIKQALLPHIPWGEGWGELTQSFRSRASASSHESYLFFPVTWGGVWGAGGQGGTSGKGCWVNAPRKAWVKCLRKAWGMNRFYPNHTMDSSRGDKDNTVKWNSAACPGASARYSNLFSGNSCPDHAPWANAGLGTAWEAFVFLDRSVYVC